MMGKEKLKIAGRVRLLTQTMTSGTDHEIYLRTRGTC